MDQLIDDFKLILLQVNRIKAKELFAHISSQEDGFQTMEELVVKSLEKIGTGWEEGVFSLAQVYMAGVICEELIFEYIPENEEKEKNNLRLGVCVLQDHHALGKQILFSILKVGGYDPLDLGEGINVEELIDSVVKKKIDVIFISTLMLPAALKIAEVKKEFQKRELNTKIIVGGAPFRLHENLWQEVGADAKGETASEILNILKEVALENGK